MSLLFSPVTINKLKLKNRIIMSPMCQYSAEDGFANDWHYVHYGTRAIGGCAAIIQEATAVSPEGRISYADLGIWKDEHIKPLSEIVKFLEKHGAVAGIQLAHAGRKASWEVPWKGDKQIIGNGGWNTIAPSALSFTQGNSTPFALDKEGIEKIKQEFKDAARRAVKAGYKILEIHAAHGYLIHQFLSPLSNKRTDEYGGSFENRIRLLLDIINEIKPLIDDEHSLWVRISATDWAEGGWTLNDSIALSEILKQKGVDVVDVSTGGSVPHAKITTGPGYQVPFASAIKKDVGITTGTVGLITTALQAENILQKGDADLIFIGRQLLRDPYFALNASKELDNDNAIVPIQYKRS
ncbi:MAG: NADH:flavin oxidoreductase/NADH oxidase [Dysgonomonas sp.]